MAKTYVLASEGVFCFIVLRFCFENVLVEIVSFYRFPFCFDIVRPFCFSFLFCFIVVSVLL